MLAISAIVAAESTSESCHRMRPNNSPFPWKKLKNKPGSSPGVTSRQVLLYRTRLQGCCCWDFVFQLKGGQGQRSHTLTPLVWALQESCPEAGSSWPCCLHVVGVLWTLLAMEMHSTPQVRGFRYNQDHYWLTAVQLKTLVTHCRRDLVTACTETGNSRDLQQSTMLYLSASISMSCPQRFASTSSQGGLQRQAGFTAVAS